MLNDPDLPAGRYGRKLRTVADVLAPSLSTTQGTTGRSHIKDVMLREFARNAAGALPVRAPLDKGEDGLPSHAPTIIIMDGEPVHLTDLDPIDPDTALLAAEALERLAARHQR